MVRLQHRLTQIQRELPRLFMAVKYRLSRDGHCGHRDFEGITAQADSARILAPWFIRLGGGTVGAYGYISGMSGSPTSRRLDRHAERRCMLGQSEK